MNKEEKLKSIESDGWIDGYYDEPCNCIYEPDTEEYLAYHNGYRKGSIASWTF